MTQWRTQTAFFQQDKAIDTSADFFQTGLFIGKDGLKLYHTDGTDKIFEYDMTTPYDISTLSLLQSKDVTAQTTTTRDIWFTPDGLTMFVLANDRIFSYNLSTAWDVSTAVFSIQKALFEDTNHDSMYFRADGLLMFTIGNGSSTEGSADRVYKYVLSTPYDISTITFTSLGGSFHVSENLPTGIFFEDNGLRMFVLGATDTIFTSDSTMWEYPLSIPFDITSTSAPSELNLEAEDTTPFGVHFQITPPKNAGARFWHGGREFDKIYEWTMAQTDVEEGFTVNAILTLEFIETEVSANIRNRFDTGDALKIGARLVIFCDNVDTNAGWIQTDPNNQIFVDEGGFPDRIHFERVPAGGGSTRRWVGKNTGKTVSGDVKFEFKFDYLDDHPTLNFSGTGSVLFADSFNHQNEATAVGRSYIGFFLTIVRSEGRHIFYGKVSDGTTTVTTIEGGTQNQHTHEIYKQTSGGTDIQKGPYFCTIELKDNKLRTSIYLDSARTQHMRGSPREADATGINPTNLQHLIVGNTLGGGSAREVTGDFDEFCVTKNEPLQIIPKKPFPAVGQFTEGWETYTLGEQNPDGWVSSNTLAGAFGGIGVIDIDIHEVSNESPEEGTQAFKQHLKYTQTNASGSVEGRATASRLVGPAVANTDGSGVDLARFLTARQKADILDGAFNAKASAIGISFSPISGAPGIGTMRLTLFGAGNVFGSNSNRLQLNSPLGTYAGFERFDLKLLLNTDSFLSDNQGVDWENHIKFVTIRIGSQTRTDFGGTGEALLNNDYISLWGTKLETFLVSALLQAEGDNGTCISPNTFSWKGNRTGGDINDDHQFQAFELRPLHSPSSTPLIIGERITAIRVTKGFGGTSRFTLAIYEGVGNNAVLKARTGEATMNGVPDVSSFDVPLLTDYLVGTTTHADVHVCIAVNPLDGSTSWRSDSINFTRKRIFYGTGGFNYPDFPPNFLLTVDNVLDETKFFELVGGDSDKQQKCFGIDAQIVLVDQVQLKPDVGATLKKLDQEKEFFMGAEIGAFETEVFFSTTHLQDITQMFSLEAPTIVQLKPKVGAKVVIRQTQNGTKVTATLKALDQEKEFFVGKVLQSTQIVEPKVNALLGGIGQTKPDVNALIKCFGAGRVCGVGFGLTGLKAYWNFDETGLAGKLFNQATAIGSPDSLGTSADGTYFTGFITLGVTGQVNTAYKFQEEPANQASNRIAIGTSNSQFNFLHNTTALFTVNMWINPVVDTFADLMIDQNNTGTNRGFQVAWGSSGGPSGFVALRIRNNKDVINANSGIDSIPTGTLSMVTVTYDQSLVSNNARFYVNGVETNVASKSLFVASDANANFPLHVGTRANNQNGVTYGGILDESTIWNRVLTPTEIAELFQLNVGGISIASGLCAKCVTVDALLSQGNIVEPTVDALLKATLETPPTGFFVDALLQEQGVITPQSQPIVDAILVTTIVPTDEEFDVNAILGLSEPESILNVESVIGHKTGIQS